MAVGFPLKTTYANGDVYSASDVTDITGTVNLLQTSTLSSQAGKNFVINGGMDIWQRGTSFNNPASAYYTADRFQGMRHSQVTGITVSRQATGDTTNLAFLQYCARISRDSGNTSTNALYFGSVIETINSIPLAGKTVTLSFYARKGANYSPASNGLNVKLISGTGTDQNNTFTSAFTGATDVISQTATLTSTWQRFSYSATIGATATELQTLVYATPVGTAGAADYYEITGIQLELGSYATTFSRAGGSIGGELALCQRYYLSWVTNTSQTVGLGTYTGAGTVVTTANFPVTMRIQPTLVVATGTNYYRFNRVSADDDFNSFTIFNTSYQAIGLYNASEVSGTNGTAGYIYTNNAAASIAFNAEL